MSVTTGEHVRESSVLQTSLGCFDDQRRPGGCFSTSAGRICQGDNAQIMAGLLTVTSIGGVFLKTMDIFAEELIVTKENQFLIPFGNNISPLP